MTERPNFYLLLGLEPSVDDWPTIQRRLAEKQREWSRDRSMGSPKALRRAERSLALLPEIERVLKDAETRREEAKEAVRQQQKARQEQARELDESIDVLMTGGGTYNEEQLKKLVQRFVGVFAEEEIKKRLRAAGVQPEGSSGLGRKPRSPKEQIEKVTASQVRQNLGHLGLATLYDFLELKPQSSPKALCDRADAIYRENQRLGRTDADASARNVLAGICKSLFQNDVEKAKYDNYLTIEVMEGLKPNLELAGMDGFLSQSEMDVLVRQARQRGVSIEDARAFIEEYAATRRWRVQLDPKLPAKAAKLESAKSDDQGHGESPTHRIGKPVSPATGEGTSPSLSSARGEAKSSGREAPDPEHQRMRSLLPKTVTNVTSKSFGVVVFNQWNREVVANLIQCNDKVPKTSSLEIKTYEEGLRSMELRCMENTLSEPQVELPDCISVGTAVLEFGRPLPKDSLVKITFDLGPDGLLTLKGRDVTTGREVRASFKTTSVLTEEQLAASRHRDLKIEVTRGRSTRTADTPLPQEISLKESPKLLRDQVFISYSHKDRKWLERLRIMLAPLVRNGISLWDDTKIEPGKDWRQEIKNALASARVAVLLVSQDFLASDFIEENELPPLLKAAREEGLTIIWLCINLCGYDETVIRTYQAVHDPAKPLVSLKGHDRDRVLLHLCKQIKAAMETSRSSN